MGGKAGVGLLVVLSFFVLAEGLSWVTASWPSPCLITIENEEEAAYNDNQKSCPTFRVGSEIILARLDRFIGDHDKSIIAAFTVVLAISTIGLWLATVRLWEAGERQLELIAGNAVRQSADMQASIAVAERYAEAAGKAAEAAERATETTERAFTLLERPRVLPIDISRITQVQIGENVTTNGISFSIGNYGKVPALVQRVMTRFAAIEFPPTRENLKRPNLRPGADTFEVSAEQIVLGPEKTSPMSRATIPETIEVEPIWGEFQGRRFTTGLRPKLPPRDNLFLEITIGYQDIASGVVREAVTLWRYGAEGFVPQRGGAFNFEREIET
jgi:hypothetical protein